MVGLSRRRDIARIHQLVCVTAWSIPTTRWRSDEVVLEGECGRRGPRRDSEFREDVLEMPRHRVLADHELGRDLAVATPGSDEAEPLEPASRQPVSIRRRAGREPAE